MRWMIRTKSKNGKADDWQLEANKAYLKYCQLRTDGKTEEAEAFAKTFARPQTTEAVNEDGNKDKDENNPYRVEKGDGKGLIAAKREAARAEAAAMLPVLEGLDAEKLHY